MKRAGVSGLLSLYSTECETKSLEIAVEGDCTSDLTTQYLFVCPFSEHVWCVLVGMGFFKFGAGLSNFGTGTPQIGTGLFDSGTGTSQTDTGLFDFGTGTLRTGTGLFDFGTGTSQTGTGLFDFGTGTLRSVTGSSRNPELKTEISSIQRQG